MKKTFIGKTLLSLPVLHFPTMEITSCNMLTFSSSFMFDSELTRIVGSASSGGCDVGEFESAVGKIKKHDAESWHAAWKEQGERAEWIGDDAAKAGFKVPARNAYISVDMKIYYIKDSILREARGFLVFIGISAHNQVEKSDS